MDLKYKQIRFDLLFFLKIKLLKTFGLIKSYTGMSKTKLSKYKVDYFYHNFPLHEEYSRTEYHPLDVVKRTQLNVYKDNSQTYYSESEWIRYNYLTKSQLEEIWKIRKL